MFCVPEAEGEELPGLHITIQELPDLLLRDVGNRIRDSGRLVLLFSQISILNQSDKAKQTRVIPSCQSSLKELI